VRPEFLEEVSEATALLNDAEALSTSVAILDGLCTTYLKTECLRLLHTACLWLAAEEQILPRARSSGARPVQ
jgi:hypothetical protein